MTVDRFKFVWLKPCSCWTRRNTEMRWHPTSLTRPIRARVLPRTCYGNKWIPKFR